MIIKDYFIPCILGLVIMCFIFSIVVYTILIYINEDYKDWENPKNNKRKRGKR